MNDMKVREGTIQSLANMPEELQVRLKEARLRKWMSELVEAVKVPEHSSQNSVEPLQNLMSLDLTIQAKFAHLDLASLLRNNCQSREQLERISSALYIMTKYGRNLLKPPATRPGQWRAVMFTNNIFRNKVDVVKGARDILYHFGYTIEITDGVAFPDGLEPDPMFTAKLTAELVLAKTELDMYSSGDHPCPGPMEQLIPTNSRIPQSVNNAKEQLTSAQLPATRRMPVETDDLSSMTVSRPSQDWIQNPPPSSQPRLPASSAHWIKTTMMPAQDLPHMRPVWQAGSEPGRTSEQAIDPDEPCDICGERPPVWKCTICDGKMLCQDCDVTWHKHPRRKTHQRERVWSPETPTSPHVPHQSPTQKLSGDIMPDTLRNVDSEIPAVVAASNVSSSSVISGMPVNLPAMLNSETAASSSIAPSAGSGPFIPAMVMSGNVPSYHNSPYSTNRSSFDSSKADLPNLSILNNLISGGVSQSKEFRGQREPESEGRSVVREVPKHSVQSDQQVPKNQEIMVKQVLSSPCRLDQIKALPDVERQRIELERMHLEFTATIDDFDFRIRKIIIDDSQFFRNPEYLNFTTSKDQFIKERIKLEEYQRTVEDIILQKQNLIHKQREAEIKQQLKTPPGNRYVPPDSVYKWLNRNSSQASEQGAVGGTGAMYRENQPFNTQQQQEYNLRIEEAHMQQLRQAGQPISGGPQVQQNTQPSGIEHIQPPSFSPHPITKNTYRHVPGFPVQTVQGVRQNLVMNPPDKHKMAEGGEMPGQSMPTLQGTARHVRIKEPDRPRLVISENERRISERERSISATSGGSTPGEYKGVCPTCSGITNYYSDICENCATEIPEYVKRIIPPSPLTPNITEPPGDSTGNDSRETSGSPEPNYLRHRRTNSGSSTGSAGNSAQRLGGHPFRWRCEHCTFMNVAGSRACDMCSRTTAKPELIMDPEIRKSSVESQQVAAPSGGGTISGAQRSTSTTSSEPKSIYITYQVEEEKMIQEKKRAQEEFKRQLEMEEAARKSGVDPNIIREAPTQSPSMQATTSSPLPDITSANLWPGGARPKHTVKNLEPLHIPVSSDPLSKVATFSPVIKGGREKREEETDVRTQLEEIAERRRQEEEAQHGRQIVSVMRAAETIGFSVEEIELALRLCKNIPPLTWMKEMWPTMIANAVAIVTSEGDSDVDCISNMSETEAKEALLRTEGNMEEAVKLCVERRKEKLAELVSGADTPVRCSKARASELLLQNGGDVEKVKLQLLHQQLTLLRCDLWEGADQYPQPTRNNQLELFKKVEISPEVEVKVQDKNLDYEKRARMILIEGKLASWGRAQTLLEILDEGTLDDSITVEDIVQAVSNYGHKQQAIAYLTKMCEVCLTDTPIHRLRSFFHCQCKVCEACLKQGFEVMIRNNHIQDLVCLVCQQPDIQIQEKAEFHFTYLEMLFQDSCILDRETLELYQNKVRDWKLMQDPNFRWCSHCDLGFIGDPTELRMTCPNPQCGHHTCFQCKKPWERQHEGLTCEQFQQWKEDNDPHHQAAGLAHHLAENGIDCPSCKFRYVLAKGGCMHFKCNQCRHEFCSGCSHPFLRGENCKLLRTCSRAGLHCHHPRDCLFYMRDYDVKQMQKLLNDNDVEHNVVPPAGKGRNERCPVMEQKETPSGMLDEACGKPAPDNCAGLCELHYKEYLVGLINKHNIDPVIIMDINELKLQLTRLNKNVPKRNPNENNAQYKNRLKQVIQRDVPLQTRKQDR